MLIQRLYVLVCVYVCMYMYVCTYIRTYAQACTYMHMYVRKYVRTFKTRTLNMYIRKSSAQETKFFWSRKYGERIVRFGNAPFRCVSKRTLDCQFGQHYFKQKQAKSNRKILQGTRKIGCRAHIEIHEYQVFPEYEVVTDGLKHMWQRSVRRKL